MRSFIKPNTGKALAIKLAAYGPACQLLARTVAQKIGVPYYEDRIVERFLGHRLKEKKDAPFVEKPLYRHNGEVVEVWPTNPETGKPLAMHQAEVITEEVWARDHWPNTADDVPHGIARLPDGKVAGIYYHGPTMCLVLLHPGGLKIGIRAGSIIDVKMGVDRVAMAALSNLKPWVEPT